MFLMAFAQRKAPTEEEDDVPVVDLDLSDARRIICTEYELSKLTMVKICVGRRGYTSLPRPQGAFHYHSRHIHEP
jgi:hypothetical protein